MTEQLFERSQDEWSELSQHFADLAHALSHDSAAQVDPERVVRFAARALPHSQHCALTLLRGEQRPKTIAATGALPRQVDELQYATREGPCLEAAEHDELVVVNDLSADERWPKFSRECITRTSVRSILSLRLSLGGRDRAAMNFYGTHVDAFNDLDAGTASVFAPFASLALKARIHEQDVANLEQALFSSRQVGTAIGILMARRSVTKHQAFDLLRRASQHLNRKLRDIASDVECTGELPGSDRPRPAS